MVSDRPVSDDGAVFLMRVALPDRPGSLGAMASVIGTVGGDIYAVEVVDRQDGYAIDDFMLALPPGTMPDEVVSACTALDDVKVLWFSRYPEGEGLEADIETLERMTAAPESAPEILAGASPSVFHCEWALLADRQRGEVRYATEMAPDLTADSLQLLAPLGESGTRELLEGWLPDWGEAIVALAPVRENLVLIVGRQGGPGFLPSELARVRHLAAMAASASGRDQRIQAEADTAG